MSKKDICPVCNSNEKNIKSKMCRSCSIKNLASLKGQKPKSKPEPKPEPEHSPEHKAPEPKPKPESKQKPKVGETTPDGMFYL